MGNNDKQLACKRCGWATSEGEWESIAIYAYNGQEGAYGGDHARCPECNKLLHIDYDLTEVE